MKENLEEVKKELKGKLPANIVADAGYGNEENYEYLEREKLGNYVKYNTFHKEASKKWKAESSGYKTGSTMKKKMNIPVVTEGFSGLNLRRHRKAKTDTKAQLGFTKAMTVRIAPIGNAAYAKQTGRISTNEFT